MNAEGAFVVVTTQLGPTQSTLSGRRFDASGDQIGDPFRIDESIAESQPETSIAMAPSGSFVVVWRRLIREIRESGDVFELDVFARRFDRAGSALSGEIQINAPTALWASSPDVTLDADGGFHVVWTGPRAHGSSSVVLGQSFDRDGRRVGTEFQVSAHTLDHQGSPSIAARPDGDLIVTWQSWQDGSTGVYARRFSHGGGGVADTDGDGVIDRSDNCPTVSNADQEDIAGDGWGDACVAPDVIIAASARIEPAR